MLPPPFDFHGFIRDHADQLRPPVNNYCAYNAKDGGNHTVMIVGGPNARNDARLAVASGPVTTS